MQVVVDVTCMCTNFGRHGLSDFEDIATYKNSQISLSDLDLLYRVHWSSKNLIDQNRLKKFMQGEIDVTCMHTNFGGHGLSGFGNKISLWSIKVEKI